MIGIADCSPLNYLILIDAVSVLPQLFEKILIPDAVGRELRSAGTPDKVADWASQPPIWLHVEPVQALEDDRLNKLHPGEREAITLALRHRHQGLLLIDESRGRVEAPACKSALWDYWESWTSPPRRGSSSFRPPLSG